MSGPAACLFNDYIVLAQRGRQCAVSEYVGTDDVVQKGTRYIRQTACKKFDTRVLITRADLEAGTKFFEKFFFKLQQRFIQSLHDQGSIQAPESAAVKYQATTLSRDIAVVKHAVMQNMDRHFPTERETSLDSGIVCWVLGQKMTNSVSEERPFKA
ncbi:hypothetical protein BKA80DRAFT_68597 [Phyllosticta citrichinensis]